MSTPTPLDFTQFRAGPTILLPPPRISSSLVMVKEPSSLAAEQYRLLAHAVEREVSRGGPRKTGCTIAVSSALAAEGKTITALNLAFALTGVNTYSFNINNGAYTTSGGLSSSGTIDTLRFFNYNSGINGVANTYDLFFNNLQVVPEPVHVALPVFGGLFALGYGIRRFTRKAQAQPA